MTFSFSDQNCVVYNETKNKNNMSDIRWYR